MIAGHGMAGSQLIAHALHSKVDLEERVVLTSWNGFGVPCRNVKKETGQSRGLYLGILI